MKREGPPGKSDDEPRIFPDDNKKTQVIKRFWWHVLTEKCVFQQ